MKLGSNSISYLTLCGDLSDFRGSWEGYIAYADSLRVMIVLGDPVVSPRKMEEAVDDIVEYSATRRSLLCFFSCTEKVADILSEKGFSCVYIGSEAITELERFSLSGREMQSIRGSVNYARRNDMVVEEYTPDSGRDREIESEILTVSRDWCGRQRTPELRFMIGGLDFDLTEGKRYFTCRHDHRMVSFIAYYPIYATGDFYLDLMRRKQDAPRGCMDYLIVESFDRLAKESVERTYLGLSPFSFLNSSKNRNSRFWNSLFSLFSNPFAFIYPAQSEFRFKKKFATSWEPNYVCYHPRMSARTILAIFNAFCPGGLISILAHKAKKFTGIRSNRTPKQI